MPHSRQPARAWPDLWIATGRATLPLSSWPCGARRGKTFVVQTQDPRLNPSRFDMVVAPAHDGLSGRQCLFEIIGSPHRITPDRIAEARASVRRSAGCPCPIRAWPS